MPDQTNDNDSDGQEEMLFFFFYQEQKLVMEINDPDVISEFIHKRKTTILELLINRERTIRELSDEMDLNPGSVKMYLDSLRKQGLVYQTKITQNQWGIRLKYYSTTAKKFLITMTFPKEKSN